MPRLHRLLTCAILGIAALPAAEEPGIASKYRGDVGLASDPDVIFVEDFEANSVSAITSKWEQCQHQESMSLSDDVPAGIGGKQSLLITAIGGQLWGGDLYRRFPDQEIVYVRYYVKFDKGCAGFHHGPMWIGGHYPSTSYPWPRAGEKPTDNRFSQASEPLGNEWRWDFYNYTPDMFAGGDNMFWGNLYISDPGWTVDRDRWICVEQMLKLNDPGDTNGEQAMWIDGKEREQNGQIISRFGKGFPKGYRTKGIFHPDPGGTPYEGITWRLRAEQKINYLWPQVFLDTAPAGVISKVWYDNMVVAKRYIGPLQIAAPKAEKIAKPAPKPAPAEPAAPKIDEKPHRDAIISALQNAKPASIDSVEMNLLGKMELVTVEEMTAVGIRVNFGGNVVPLKWQNIGSTDLITMTMTALPKNPQAVYEAGVLAAAIRADPRLQKEICDALWPLDAEKAKQLKEVAQH